MSAPAPVTVQRLTAPVALSCAPGFPVVRDAVPRVLGLQQLAQIARSDPSAEKADKTVERAGQTEVVQASLELPTDGDGVQKQPEPAPPPALNREPGRLFGPTAVKK